MRRPDSSRRWNPLWKVDSTAVLFRRLTPPDRFRSTRFHARCGCTPRRADGRSGCKTRRWKPQGGTHNSSGNLPEFFDSRLDCSYKRGPVIGPDGLVVGAVHEALRLVVNCRWISKNLDPVRRDAGTTSHPTKHQRCCEYSHRDARLDEPAADGNERV